MPANLAPSATVVSDAGRWCARNDDVAHVDDRGQFFIVAGGMGARAAGEVASWTAVQVVRAALEAGRARIDAFAAAPGDDTRRELVQLLDGGIHAAHQAVHAHGTDGVANLDVLVIAGSEAIVAHVGDTRTYLVRGGEAVKVTTDHTMADVMVLEGSLSAAEAEGSLLRTVLVNAVGSTASDVVVEVVHLSLRAGDRLLLSTEGLYDVFPDERDVADLLSDADPEHALAGVALVARVRGGNESITGVLVEVPADETPADADPVGELPEVWDALVVELLDHHP